MRSTKTFQIRDDTFGLRLIEADDARDALLVYLADRAKAEHRPNIEVRDDGTAAIRLGVIEYRAVPVTT